MITYASLCSGYGGLDRAAVALFGPGPVLWHAEVAPAPVKILEAHWPGTPNVGDITTARWSSWDRPDVLSMGPPCQPVSAAGRKLGQEDERWLWPYAHRALVDIRPGAFVFENVSALVWFERGSLWSSMLEDMRSSGYAVRWGIIGACAVGACHHRHRVFAYGRFVGLSAPDPVRVVPQTCGARRSDPLRRLLLPTPRAADGLGGRADNRRPGQPGTLSSALLPSPMARDGRDRSPGAGSAAYWASRPRKQGIMLDAALATVPPDGEPFGRYTAAVELHAQIFRRTPPAPLEAGPRGGLRLAAVFPEWMMGLSAGYLTDHVDRADALRAAGNGVLPLQAYTALRILSDESCSPALTPVHY